MSLTTQEQILIEQRVTNEAKSIAAAYLLWFFLGGFGVHRFYLGRIRTAIAILSLTILGLVLSAIGIGVLLLAAVGIWLLVDAFLIPGIVRRHKEQVRQELTAKVAAQPVNEPEVTAAPVN